MTFIRSFYITGDALVDRFMVRDLDSIISSREIAAVKVWLKSGKTYHMMRDHPYHTVVILGGNGSFITKSYILQVKKKYFFLYCYDFQVCGVVLIGTSVRLQP